MVLQIDIHDEAMFLRLNRPDRLNAFNAELHGALRQCLERAAKEDSIRAVLITGNGRGFCAGQDLADRDPTKAEYDLSETLSEYYNPLVRTIRGMQKPVVCAVNGVAAGAGANLAFGCDIVLAAKSAKFIQSFAKVGLVPDAGGTWLLPRLIGEMRAKALAMTAAPLTADQAKEWGLVWQVFADENLHKEAMEFTVSLARGATYGLGLTKSLIHSQAAHTLDEHLDIEAEFQGKAGYSDDYKEGVLAFLEKRAPQFQGK